MSAEKPEFTEFTGALLPRRHFLWSSAAGIGGLALAWMLNRENRAAAAASGQFVLSHFSPRARRVVQIFCAGGVSHIDTFDYKPDLEKLHGKTLEGKGENKGFFGQPGRIMKSPFEFQRYGESGHWVSSLLPHLATCVDNVSFIHSMVAKSNNHTPATFQMNSGFTMNGFPCMGSWISYGLGAENENLPAFVVLPDPRGNPAGGSINWTAGFLPAKHQGVAFRTNSSSPVVDLKTPESIRATDREKDLCFLADINRRFADENPEEADFSARLRSYELAARMQLSIPEAVDLSNEPEHVRKLYGLDDKRSEGFGRNCLLARRLLERGVRFVQIFNGGAFGSPRINWDGHENVSENHRVQAATMDRPATALIKDLKQRGMLDDTLVIWNTEFGRGPATQGLDSTGRDHHPDAFTCFLAGGGTKAGFSWGASDEVGYFASENPVTIYDLHATILHLLGIDHEKLTFYHNGINRRLTDVHGHVVRELLA
ncbi:MAG TPA: DUF1501 domain-containing protein [Verrucomicrobiae bacterium]|jgi:hypothetical protein|nr:DUF1501 domain-containing protein [Verrucomicrobiae bacterium]